ncbi:MAG: hypothetical protein AAF939_09390, partial [Planctomycetota bacterium]
VPGAYYGSFLNHHYGDLHAGGGNFSNAQATALWADFCNAGCGATVGGGCGHGRLRGRHSCLGGCRSAAVAAPCNSGCGAPVAVSGYSTIGSYSSVGSCGGCGGCLSRLFSGKLRNGIFGGFGLGCCGSNCFGYPGTNCCGFGGLGLGSRIGCGAGCGVAAVDPCGGNVAGCGGCGNRHRIKGCIGGLVKRIFHRGGGCRLFGHSRCNVGCNSAYFDEMVGFEYGTAGMQSYVSGIANQCCGSTAVVPGVATPMNGSVQPSHAPIAAPAPAAPSQGNQIISEPVTSNGGN